MSDTAITGAKSENGTLARSASGLFSGRRGKRLKEAILAYAFLIPAFIIVFTFGIFPLAFSAYESTLRGLNRVLGTYDGLGNYVKALDNLAYVLGFWVGIVLIYLCVRSLTQLYKTAEEKNDRPWILAIPGILMGIAVALIARFVFTLLPEMLAIPDKMRGQENTSELFRQYVGEAWRLENVQAAFWAGVIALLIAIATITLVYRFTTRTPRSGSYYSTFIQVSIMLIGTLGLFWLTWTQIQQATTAALEDGEILEIWPQITIISAGFVLLLLAWFLWRSASHRDSMISTVLRLGAAAMLIVGAWVLIGELPRAIAAGDEDWWVGLQVTAYYALGTIPVQLMAGLLFATLLFQNIKGKTFFRMIYFLPYIAPFVGTAAAFRILFSGRANAPINSLLGLFHIAPLAWLNEPTGLLKLILGTHATLPDWAVGPSLALIVIMIFGTWTFFGFNTVVFLAGLGSIPSELYEAAAIDGAGRWDQFRHVTLPLLSPTIYFLVLWTTIGTFKAFNHIYVLREGAALGTTDTASVVIFQAFKRDTRYGYASALAILLLIIILVLTAVNNRIASRRVFYG
ncbi:MAG: sugar ABC transporter permease [Candidatus Promineifilaceae bacterium]